MRWLAISSLVIVTVLAAIGCGPSLRRVHRSDVYFERCYAADLDERVPAEERRACWQAWMAHWQADQPPERVDYVRERLLQLDPERAAIVALATGTDEAEPEAPTEGAPDADTDSASISSPEGETRSASAELAASQAPSVRQSADGAAEAVGEPDPAARTVAPARARRTARPPLMPHVDSPHCAEACRPRWLACAERCNEHDRMACQRACRLELRMCARACY